MQKKRDEELLSEIGDEAELRKENLRLNQVIDHLKEKLREKEESFDKLLGNFLSKFLRVYEHFAGLALAGSDLLRLEHSVRNTLKGKIQK